MRSSTIRSLVIQLIVVVFFSLKAVAQNTKLDSMLTILKAAVQDTNRVKTLYRTARVYLENSQYAEGLKYSEEARDLSEKLNFVQGKILSYNFIGMAMRERGDFSKAIENYQHSLKISIDRNDKGGMAAAYSNIGVVYGIRGNYELAKDYFMKAIKYETETGDKLGIADAYNNLAVVHRMLNNFDLAITTYITSFKLYSELGNKKGIGSTYNNMANIYFAKGDYKKSLEAHQKSYEINKELGNEEDIAVNLGSIARDQFKLGNIKEGEKLYNEALVLSKKIGGAFLIKNIYENLAEVNFETKDYKKAYEFQKLYSKMSDSLYNENSSRQIAEMTARFEDEKKTHDLELKESELKEQKTDAEKKDLQRNSVIAGTILLVILGFFIFRSYRQKQKANLEKIKKEKVQAELTLLKNQISPHVMFNSLNTIYFQVDENKEAAKEMILKFADLLRYQLYECDVEFIEIDKEISYLKKFVEIQQLRKSGRCKITFDIAEEVTDFKIAPLLMIPLVENAFKYLTNRKDTENFVYISLTKDRNQMCFVIENTTADIPKEKKESGGIGISNLKSRLSLIYPKKHELLINKENNIFKVKLTIDVG